MNALIVYDSVFGNTEKIAHAVGAAIGDALGSRGNVETLPVGRVTIDQIHGLDVLVVGSPTRGFRPTEAITRLLNALPKHHLDGVQVAAFDTRILLDTINSSIFRFVVDKGGYAAGTIAKRLEQKGGKLIAPPEGFLVVDTEGPLQDGELERAAAWAKSLDQHLG
jgi:flavodoxin